MATKKYEHIGILPLELPMGDKKILKIETGEAFEYDFAAQAPTLEPFLFQAGLIHDAPGCVGGVATASTVDAPEILPMEQFPVASFSPRKGGK